ncbi:MAG: type I restriction endonuclease subunit R [Leadbetterella sp.]|nr:type I restriction endonuclease subunit R [Leadbetterella sp.]
MRGIGDIERITHNRVVAFFKNVLGYQYLGNWTDRENNSNVEAEYLFAFLTSVLGYQADLANRAIDIFVKAAGDTSRSLYEVNKDVYNYIRYGVPVKMEAGSPTQSVFLFDFKNPLKNHFAVAEEVTVKGSHDKRPDIVLYINGIALSIIELKRSKVSVSEGIRQNLDNQHSNFIRHFFTTTQFLFAGNDTEYLRYGTIETPEKEYLRWNEQPNQHDYPLDAQLELLCSKERIIELLHDFIVFDSGKKKLPRPNQYFGIKAAQTRVKNREGGIIWHTQGSGKSITMVLLAKWIRENITNSRVLIITDREELDGQIEGVFQGVEEQIVRAKNGIGLIDMLNSTSPWLMCSLIHKFGRRNNEDDAYDDYLEQIKNSLPPGYSAKGDIYVYIDECHRTQSGELHKAMKAIVPNAVFIGFTGTPLLSKDKQTSMETFGTFIHTYKFDEAVRDKVVLDLRYEARDVEQEIHSEDKVNQWFEAKTSGLTNVAKMRLKQRWGTLQKVFSSSDRLEKIANDIIFDFETKDRLMNGRGNAMLVASSIYEACRYYEIFQRKGFAKCAIVTSYSPNIADTKGESTGEEQETENVMKYETYVKMLGGKTIEQFDKDTKETFKKYPAQMKLLIVVDKLLTGFDAPSATYLYIDKSLQDHGLFQAICRVNRVEGEDKTYGYIVDYKDLFGNIKKAMEEFTSGAFEKYDKADIQGLLKNRFKEAKDELEDLLEQGRRMIEQVEPPKRTPEFIKFFCGDTSNSQDLNDNEQRRLSFYKCVSAIVRSYANIASELAQCGYTPKDAEKLKSEINDFVAIRDEIKLASGDYIDLKVYEPAMRHLIDTYINAKESTKISAFDDEDMTLMNLIVIKGKGFVDDLPEGIKKNQNAVAETIEHNLRKVIIEERPTNPKYFDTMAEVLNSLIEERKSKVKDYEKYLSEIIELAKNVVQPAHFKSYPPTINTKAKQAFYDNLEGNEQLSVVLDEAVRYTKKHNWRGDKLKEREIINVLKDHIPDKDINTIFEIIKNQSDY